MLINIFFLEFKIYSCRYNERKHLDRPTLYTLQITRVGVYLYSMKILKHINMIGQYNFEHDTILSASRDGDVDAAVNLMTKHIDKATERAKNEFHHDEEEDAAQVSASKSSSA